MRSYISLVIFIPLVFLLISFISIFFAYRVSSNIRKTLLIIISLMPIVIGLFWFWSQQETYCFFYPGIDTYYSSRFSEESFNNIKIGMSIKEVNDMLGEPLRSNTKKSSASEMIYNYYTSDGKCSFGDFAWLWRQVNFKDGFVTECIKYTQHD